MTQDEMKIIGDKIAKGEAKPEEKLAFFKEMNLLVEGMRSDIAALKVAEKRSEIEALLKAKQKE